MKIEKFILIVLLSSLTLIHGQTVLAQQADDVFSKACQDLGSGWKIQTKFLPINICSRQVPGGEKCGQGNSAVDCFGCATSYITGAVCCQKNNGTASEYQCVNIKNQGFNTASADATSQDNIKNCLGEGFHEAVSCFFVSCCKPYTCNTLTAGQVQCLAPAGTYNNVADLQPETKDEVIFDPQVTIPGTIFTKGKPIKINNSLLAEYIGGFYKFFVGFMAVVAVVMIMWGGFKRIMAAGNAENVKNANGTIFAAIIGLVITLISYTLLNLINPALVSFKPLMIEPVTREDLIIVETGSDSGKATLSESNPVGGKCSEEDKVVVIDVTKFGGVYASDKRLLPEAYQKLLEVENELFAKDGKKLQINSAFRSVAVQDKLWQKALVKFGSEEKAIEYVARPKCGAPHLTGGAVDVCISGSQSCTKMTSAWAHYDKYGDETKNPELKDVKLLQEVMAKFGWVRYCGEWWHFEYGTERWQRGKGLPASDYRNKCV
ncbi:MAG: D-alanyl-D-alanine carboxypeptidase family protein [Candidatus Kerfeldbacteria bacterium]|nr:D-alanyl-D-alanine carboxypeptidase family protein [Candidatus Kerfeldbacteria bacterium]